MLLQNKNAIIYGASNSLGGAVARAFAKEGATVFLTGRHIDTIQPVANDILQSGGKAEVAVVDALDKQAIETHIHKVMDRVGAVDVSFNLIGVEGVQNIPLIDMTLDDFIRPINIAMQTQFLTITAAGRVMKEQRSGVILSLTATPGGIGYPLVGGFGPACCAIESLSRDIASELGPFGVRVVNIRSAGSPDSRPFMEAMSHAEGPTKTFLQKLEDDTMLKKLPMMADIANTAVFLSSDMSSKITGVTLDVTCGTTTGLNYTKVIPFVENK
jgi:3-oxoacyl-[acyl-carrier protein] reductase